MLEFACPACGHKLKVKDELAGRKGKCPHCNQPLTVPGVAGLASARRLMDAATVPPCSPGQGPVMEEAPTVPPEHAAAAGEAARGDTKSDPEATGSLNGGAHHSPLTDFLAPPQGPGEIGRLGPYRVLKILGAGGMGVVFRAEDVHLQRQVALKAMLPALAASAVCRERFLREARSAAAVEHDHIVAVYQVGEDRGVPYLAMPLLRGEPLDERLRREKVLSLSETLRIGRETAIGLEAARQRGLIHRDIKPANLWLEADTGRVKILDFGLARAAEGETGLTQQGAILGTPAYMAPEQAGGKTDHRADLFSLGCVLYRMATGEAPFKGSDTISTLMAVATEHPPPPSEVNRKVPRTLSDLVMRLLAKKPDDRPASAQGVVEAIRAIEAGPRQAPAPAPTPGPAAPRKRTSRLASNPDPTVPMAAPRPPPPPKKMGGMLASLLCAVILLSALGGGGLYLWMHPELLQPLRPTLSASVPPVKDGTNTEPPPPTTTPTVSAKEENVWQPLFNGKDLNGWTPQEPAKTKLDRWGVEDGVLFTRGERDCLLTDKEYGDYELLLEYRLTMRAWGGVLLRAEPGDVDHATIGFPEGMVGGGKERATNLLAVQLIDDPSYVKTLKFAEATGSLFGLVPSSGAAAARPRGEWNHMSITVRGHEVKVEINWVKAQDCDLTYYKDQVARYPGLMRTKGRIGLQSHTNRVDFREIAIRPLPAEKAEVKKP